MSGSREHCVILYGKWRSVALWWFPIKGYTRLLTTPEQQQQKQKQQQQQTSI